MAASGNRYLQFNGRDKYFRSEMFGRNCWPSPPLSDALEKTLFEIHLPH
jgi:hypothetical protein